MRKLQLANLGITDDEYNIVYLDGPIVEEDRDPEVFSEKIGVQIPPNIPELPRDFKQSSAPNTHGKSCMFDMRDYCIDCVEKYCALAGISRQSLKRATTPFCPEGSLLPADDSIAGELAVASSAPKWTDFT